MGDYFARDVPAPGVYVSSPVNRLQRTEVVPVAAELIKSAAANRPEDLKKEAGAGSTVLFPVCFVRRREQPRGRGESLRAKTDGREQLIWSAPALIAGEVTFDLNFA